MYKIFINNFPLFIADNSVKEVFEKKTILTRDPQEKEIIEFLELSHNNKDFFDKTYFISDDPKKLFKRFSDCCKVIEAAGGVVRNKKGKLLMIYRNDKWDLPKGKVEKEEEIKAAAIREVEEECGISELSITKELPPTYHTYLHKEKYVLKKTYWFEMTCSDDKKLIPQTEEGITEVKWMSDIEVKEAMKNTFLSVIDVIS